jgi:hypothetical protein
MSDLSPGTVPTDADDVVELILGSGFVGANSRAALPMRC